MNSWYHVGSGREKPGRTGFAHLFEHLMFEGSKNVPEGAFDRWLEAVGGDNNGSTNRSTARTTTRTCPRTRSSWRSASRPTAWASCSTAMTQAKVDGQRDVVKNERRQRYENQPYGMVERRAAGRALPAGPPVLLAGDRLDGGPLRRELGRREGLLPQVLRPDQRERS